MNRPGRLRGDGEAQSLELTLERHAMEASTFTDVWQRLVDGLNEQIAMLEEDWTILAVNQAWARQAALYGPGAFMPGTNYLRACRKMAAEGLQIALDVVKGMEEIDAGKRLSFRIVYRSIKPESELEHEQH